MIGITNWGYVNSQYVPGSVAEPVYISLTGAGEKQCHKITAGYADLALSVIYNDDTYGQLFILKNISPVDLPTLVFFGSNNSRGIFNNITNNHLELLFSAVIGLRQSQEFDISHIVIPSGDSLVAILGLPTQYSISGTIGNHFPLLCMQGQTFFGNDRGSEKFPLSGKRI
jgi:hypothetical protein